MWMARWQATEISKMHNVHLQRWGYTLSIDQILKRRCMGLGVTSVKLPHLIVSSLEKLQWGRLHSHTDTHSHTYIHMASYIPTHRDLKCKTPPALSVPSHTHGTDHGEALTYRPSPTGMNWLCGVSAKEWTGQQVPDWKELKCVLDSTHFSYCLRQGKSKELVPKPKATAKQQPEPREGGLTPGT